MTRKLTASGFGIWDSGFVGVVCPTSNNVQMCGWFSEAIRRASRANAVWKKIRRGELAVEEGQQLVEDMSRIAVDTISCRSLAADAHSLASATGRTVYDALYLTLAIRLDTRMSTADDRLDAALAGIPAVASHIQLVQTFEP